MPQPHGGDGGEGQETDTSSPPKYQTEPDQYSQFEASVGRSALLLLALLMLEAAELCAGRLLGGGGHSLRTRQHGEIGGELPRSPSHRSGTIDFKVQFRTPLSCPRPPGAFRGSRHGNLTQDQRQASVEERRQEQVRNKDTIE